MDAFTELFTKDKVDINDVTNVRTKPHCMTIIERHSTKDAEKMLNFQIMTQQTARIPQLVVVSELQFDFSEQEKTCCTNYRS